jgi:hypothetical protein
MTITTTKGHTAPSAAPGTRRIRPVVLVLVGLGVVVFLLSAVAGWAMLRPATHHTKAAAIPATPITGYVGYNVYRDQAPSWVPSMAPLMLGGSVYQEQVPQYGPSMAPLLPGGSVYNEQTH